MDQQHAAFRSVQQSNHCVREEFLYELQQSNHCVREEFLYELKAGPAGGRLRRPSSRRQRQGGNQPYLWPSLSFTVSTAIRFK